MINYAPHPQEFYCLNLPFKNKMMKELILGIGDLKHVNDPALWNLLVITSKLPYMWESSSVKKGDRPAQFATLEAAKKDITNYIGNNLIGNMVRNLNPLEFLEEVKKNILSHLELCKFFNGDEGGLKLIIEARAKTWAAANGYKLTKRDQTIIGMIKGVEI